MPQRFEPVSAYAPSAGYNLLPFRFGRIPGAPQKVLIVNEVGEFLFLTQKDFDALVSHRLDSTSGLHRDLRARHFIADAGGDLHLESLAAKYRTRKAFLYQPWGLQIFVATLRCDHSCRYCQVSRQTADRTRYDMTEDTARKAIDLLFRSPHPNITVEFQGGEPLLNFPLVRFAIDEIEERNLVHGKSFRYVIASTLHLLDDEMLAYLRYRNVHLSTSLDGPEWLHNANRPNRDRSGYRRTIDGIERARAALGDDAVAALTTITRSGLSHPREIVDAYVELGFRSVFLRPLSPYGFATLTEKTIGYSMADFLVFYREALDYIVDLNLRGVILDEAYATTLLTHILTPFPTGYTDLRSPAGAGLGAVVYNYDGGVYPSDEARMLTEMGDDSFRLGSVEDSFEDLLSSEAMQIIAEAGCAESLPGCSDCVFLPYCGADPIAGYGHQRDPVGHRPTSPFCAKQTGIFHELFRRLHEARPEVLRVFLAWIQGRTIEETPAVSYLA